MSTVKVPPAEAECTRSCRSKQHGAALVSTLTLRDITSSAFISYLKWLCANCGHVTDMYGRTALHIAASCGLKDVAVWLVKHSDANVNAKDYESGYTPLHRSIFYGQIHAAVGLIQLGANVVAVDHDELTAIDHLMKDRSPLLQYSLSYPCEVYVWGTNTNYTLGLGTQQCRPQPELLDSFRKQGISIKQVAMHKFHTVFVSHDGRAFSCGHGQGGRLGLESEKPVLTPQQLKLGNQSGTNPPEICCAASLGRDHTVLLMESGAVMTCGLNYHHQLGHTPPPKFLTSPRTILHKAVKNIGPVLGVCAARFHTVIWASKAVLTFGLHAGQLGYPKGPETTQIVPKLVSALSHKDHDITHVAASDGATVVAVRKGDIYVLHEYQCRKIASKQLDVVRLAVVGGHLDSKVDTNILMDQGGEQLKIVVLTSTGKLLLWQESSQQLTRCLFSLNRPLVISDVSINRSQLLLVTQDGEAFEGELKIRKLRKHVRPAQQESGRQFHEFVDREECEIVKVKRLPHVHRAVTVTSELKGRNFAIIQTNPKAALVAIPQVETSEMKKQMMSLLQEAHAEDLIHDLVFQVGRQDFVAHHYVVASRSEPLAKLIQEQQMQSGACKEAAFRVKIDHMRPEIFEQILQFIYTNDCNLLKPGVCPIKVDTSCISGNNKYNNNSGDNSDNLALLSAYEVYSQEAHKRKHKNSQTNEQLIRDPIKLAQEAAKRFDLSSLRKKLDKFRYEDGYIVAKEGSYQSEKPYFDLKKHQDLYDVTVRSEEGREIKAHKCILTARLEYLNNMLSHGWVENSENVCLRLPAPYNVLEVLIEFLYGDESPALHSTEDMDLVCRTLIAADQLFAKRLKEICEVALTGMLTLRNVAEMLQFAHTYSANQLKQCCMQFVCLNLAALLECRILEILSEDLLVDLTKYYWDFNPKLSGRVIYPFADAPPDSQVEAVAAAYPAYWQDEEDTDVTDTSSKKSSKTAKRKQRPRKTSTSEANKENDRVRRESMSSNLSNNSEDGDITKGFHSLNFDELTEKGSDITLTLNNFPLSNETSSWVKVNKNQKILQARLKAINAVKEAPSLVDTIEETFTRLSPRRSSPIKCSPSRKSIVNMQHNSPCQDEVNEPVSPPPDLSLDFPVLQSSPPAQPDICLRTPHRTCNTKKLTKISQKQRKKLAAEMNSGTLGDQLQQLNQQARPAWRDNLSEAGHSFSFMDVMQAEMHRKKHGSSPVEIKKPSNSQPPANPWFRSEAASSCSPKLASEETRSFMDIMADEKKQQSNLAKMRDKPLQLTQIEDRAIEELLVFYNAAGATDERITVRRVVTEEIAAPVWVTSHHSHH